MTTEVSSGMDLVMFHLREAADDLRQANHAIVDDRCEVTDLYDILGALDSVSQRLPYLIGYLRRVVAGADADFYRHDDESAEVAEILNLAERALDGAFEAACQLCDELGEAWCGIAHLRVHDPDVTDRA
jgi:hypothetical protein